MGGSAQQLAPDSRRSGMLRPIIAIALAAGLAATVVLGVSMGWAVLGPGAHEGLSRARHPTGRAGMEHGGVPGRGA